MVAEAQAPSTTAPIKRGLQRTSPIPLAKKVRIRSLYLVKGLTPTQIAQQVDLKPSQVITILTAEGLAKTRRSIAAANAQFIAQAQADAAAAVAQGIAAESTELAMEALNVTRAGLAAGGINGAKQAALGSQAARNLVAIARDVVRQDRSDSDQPRSLNLFFLTAAPAQEMKQAIPVSSGPAQVVDNPS